MCGHEDCFLVSTTITTTTTTTTTKIPGNLRKLADTQSPVETHQLTMGRKTLK